MPPKPLSAISSHPQPVVSTSGGFWRRFALFSALLLAFCFALAACSGPAERVPVPAAATASAAEATVETTNDPSPTVASTPAPSLADDETASVTDLDAGDQMIDSAGNLVAIHSIRRVPADLVASIDSLSGADAGLAALDVSMCTAGAFVETSAGSVEFGVVESLTARLHDGPAPAAGSALRSPGFGLPDPGECHRGWLTVFDNAASGTESTVARYVLATFGDDGLERHVYQWTVPYVSTEPTVDDGPVFEPFAVGQSVTFNEGPLVGSTVAFNGWAELIDAPAPAGQRMIGVSLEVCAETEDWPEFGVTVGGFNLIAPLDPGDRLGADPLAPLTGSCFADWAEFAVPLGQVPSGFYASDGIDPVNGFAQWTFVGAAVRPPS